MPLPLFAAADLPLSLEPTTDLPHTVVEHEDQKPILLGGQNHFDTQNVCNVRAGTGPRLLRSHFPVFTATIGSRDPLAPAVGFFGGIHGLERIGTLAVREQLTIRPFSLALDCHSGYGFSDSMVSLCQNAAAHATLAEGNWGQTPIKSECHK